MARSERLLRISTHDGADEICTRCEVADRPLRRMRGLLGRSGIDAGAGMLIVPCPSVMTFFMRFAIDVVFLDRDYRVVKVVGNLGPWRLASARAHSALELPAGTAKAHALAVGDVLEIAAADA